MELDISTILPAPCVTIISLPLISDSKILQISFRFLAKKAFFFFSMSAFTKSYELIFCKFCSPAE